MVHQNQGEGQDWMVFNQRDGTYLIAQGDNSFGQFNWVINAQSNSQKDFRDSSSQYVSISKDNNRMQTCWKILAQPEELAQFNKQIELG